MKNFVINEHKWVTKSIWTNKDELKKQTYDMLDDKNKDIVNDIKGQRRNYMKGTMLYIDRLLQHGDNVCSCNNEQYKSINQQINKTENVSLRQRHQEYTFHQEYDKHRDQK
eukprot:3339849-Amphidinium_carterae.3